LNNQLYTKTLAKVGFLLEFFEYIPVATKNYPAVRAKMFAHFF
jgi:hypothetical protein